MFFTVVTREPSTCPWPEPHLTNQRPVTCFLKTRLGIIPWPKDEFFYSSVCYHMLFEQGKVAGTDRTIEVILCRPGHTVSFTGESSSYSGRSSIMEWPFPMYRLAVSFHWRWTRWIDNRSRIRSAKPTQKNQIALTTTVLLAALFCQQDSESWSPLPRQRSLSRYEYSLRSD